MATSLIANLSSHFEPAKYTNRYREELVKLIEAKVAGQEVYAPAEPEKGKVIDLMEALRASLAATEKAKEKQEGAGPAGAGGGRRRERSDRHARMAGRMVRHGPYPIHSLVGAGIRP